jgi:hypothetical protein
MVGASIKMFIVMLNTKTAIHAERVSSKVLSRGDGCGLLAEPGAERENNEDIL